MVEPPSIRSFLKAIASAWFSAMSGGLGVLLSIAAVFVATPTLRYVLASLAAVAFFSAAYRIWSLERCRFIRLKRELSDLTRLKLSFDPSDRTQEPGDYFGTANSYWLTVENASSSKTVEDLTVTGTGDLVAFLSMQRKMSNGMLLGPAAIHPGVAKKVLIARVNDWDGSAADSPLGKPSTFEVRATGKDAKMATLSLDYVPNRSPHFQVLGAKTPQQRTPAG